MSESEYKKLVMADYDRRFAAGLLPSELLSPTPAGLKGEAIKVCERRFNTKDETILMSFYNQKEDMAAYRVAIQNRNADLFRPLVNFLEDRSINTNLKNINLLAWLIDFNPRPFHPDLVYDAQSGVPPKASVTGLDDIAHDVTFTLPDKPTGKSNKWIALCVLFLIIISGAIYFFVHHSTHQVTGHEGCMIWSNDHYEPADCADKSSGTRPSPIRHELVEHFKRITRPDTLTLYSVGKVWYAKYNGRVEFYTAAGPYPLDSNRRVLPMSDHILKKYVYHITN